MHTTTRNNTLHLIHRQIELLAQKQPDHIAVDEGDRSVSYGQLVRNSRKLANRLLRHVGERNARVGVFIENSIEAYTAILGTLFADCCYVPIGTTLPSPRIAGILEDAGAHALITVKAQLPSIAEVMAHSPGTGLLIVLDADAADLDQPSGETLRQLFNRIVFRSELENEAETPLPHRNIGEDLAYIIFTSGTTGRPKGVVISHLSLRDFVNWAVDYLGIRPEDRVSNHPSIHFDLSIIDIFGCLAAGATLCPVTKPGDRFLPGRFIDHMAITIWVSVPSVLATMQKGRQLKPGAYAKRLRAAVFCGEALSADLTQALQATNPEMKIHNLYGPTEATCACTHFLVDSDRLDCGKPVPIGVPNLNTELFVLKEDADEPVAPQEIGRLMIGGSQLAHGYWKRDDLTRKAFCSNPLKKYLPARMYDTGDLAYLDESGIFHYIGRRDQQVKIQGYRVELSEIEIAACKHLAVVDAGACLVGDGNAIIALGIVPASGVEEDQLLVEVAKLCNESLPHYMIPKQLHIFDAIPKNINGKKDRKQLTQLFMDEHDA